MEVPEHLQGMVWNNLAAEGWAIEERMRPSHLYRPHLSIDGDQWCALYGENLQDGVAGFGDSPDAAYRAFDKAWCEKLKGRTDAGV